MTAGHAAFAARLEQLTLAMRAGYLSAAEALKLLGKYETEWGAATAPQQGTPAVEVDPEPFREVKSLVLDIETATEGTLEVIEAAILAQAEGVEVARMTREEWLDLVHSSRAKARIKQHIRHRARELAVETGRSLLRARLEPRATRQRHQSRRRRQQLPSIRL